MLPREIHDAVDALNAIDECMHEIVTYIDDSVTRYQPLTPPREQTSRRAKMTIL